MNLKFVIVLLILPLSIYGKEVPVEMARGVAVNFLYQHAYSPLKTNMQFELTRVPFPSEDAFSQHSKKSASGNELLYMFEVNDNEGFIIVSGDDLAVPILGYSLEKNFKISNLPDNYRKWIEGYKNQIRYIRSMPENGASDIKDQWEHLISGKRVAETKSLSVIPPLVTTKWDQGGYYNELCPYDPEYGENSVTGCVATAMAQILKYWNYPETGNGFHSYNHTNFGVISANFGNTSYNWTGMPDVVESQNNSVATLMYQCGVSVEMNYSTPGSYAYVVSDASPVEHCSEFAFKEHFGMDESLRGIQRENFTTAAWVQVIKTELEEGRPLEYAGFGSGGGHAFICDGYDENDFFHFNWGWGGYFDGYFALDALDPTGIGIGGGSGAYNSGQQAIIGIKPPQNTISYDLSFYDTLTISENLIFFADSFAIHTDIGNFGERTFSGDFCAAIFDEDNNFIEYAEILEGAVLEGGMHYTNGLDFSNPGSVSLLPGNYYAGIFYRATGENWKVVGDGMYSNFIAFEIYYSSDIELYEDFVISTGNKIVQNTPFSVTAGILNDGSSVFSGDFDISLYDMEGNFVVTIETRSVDSLRPNYYLPGFEFATAGITVEPGTYLMALLHLPEGGDWTLSGSSYFTNPVKVIVAEAPLEPDIYEDNDSIANPYLLDLSFSDNFARTVTDGSNAHVGTDIDYYYIVLEDGYRYSISARVHDSYNSGNQQTYTNDVIWSYYLNGAWSDVYDDVMPGSISIPNGAALYFGIAPYYEGETGTYLLDIQVTRQKTVSTDMSYVKSLKVFPNPTSNILNIESSEEIDRISIVDTEGRMVITREENTPIISMDISFMKSGIYFLHITQQDHTSIRKIVKE